MTDLIATAAACLAIASTLGAWSLQRRLTALRKHAYLTDHDGVRRRWSKVSAAVRSRAENN